MPYKVIQNTEKKFKRKVLSINDKLEIIINTLVIKFTHYTFVLTALF